MSHLGFGQGFFHRLNEIVTHRLGQRVFETYRCKPFGLAERSAGFTERKGAMYPLSLSVQPGRRPEGDDNDPNCALCDCRVSVGPLGLHKPI